MSKILPPVIESYFQAQNAHNTGAMAICFSEDAIVQDEGKEFRGIEAVTKWIEAVTGKYHATVEITDIKEQSGATVVTGLVAGNFAGSPLSLDFYFSLKGDKISALTIQ